MLVVEGTSSSVDVLEAPGTEAPRSHVNIGASGDTFSLVLEIISRPTILTIDFTTTEQAKR
jgi:hypothetical protein